MVHPNSNVCVMPDNEQTDPIDSYQTEYVERKNQTTDEVRGPWSNLTKSNVCVFPNNEQTDPMNNLEKKQTVPPVFIKLNTLKGRPNDE